jgi:hypothetical protein
MKNNATGHVANKLNISMSTASKAIRHCSGVDSETRQSVLDELRIINYRPQSKCDIYAIVPDVPQHFWKQIRQGLQLGKDAHGISVKCNVYTNLRDESVVLEYLEEAELLNARAIIIAARITPKIQEKLASMTEGRLVLFLSEKHELTNTFYIGGDPHSDGYLMGKQYMTNYADRQLILLSNPNNATAQVRLEGFEAALKESANEYIQKAIYLNVDATVLKNPKLLPSKLAPLLLDVSKDFESLCIYSTFGLIQMPIAIGKAKLTDKVVCMCHDYFSEKQDTCIKVICNQDVESQGETAVRLAAHYVRQNNYPNEKLTIVPSMVNTNK